MRIGLVRRGYSASGGAESYLRGFAQSALAAGHETVLFCSPEWNGWDFGKMIRVAGKSPGSFSDQLDALNPKNHCDVVFSLERVAHCDFYRAGDGVHAAWLLRRPASALGRIGFQLNPKHRALLRLERQAVLGARCVISNSQMIRREIHESYGDQVRVEVVHNGIDASKWSRPSIPRAELRERLGIEPDARVAIFVGSGWERKGLQFAVAATQKAGAILLVCGSGKSKQYQRSHVQFLGAAEGVVDYLHAADAFILPTFYDPFSNATLEALAAGLPVITTTSNGVHEIMDPDIDGTALENPKDISALAAALERWVSDENQATRRMHAAKFTLERNFLETLHIITS